ncbi:hypothetical protein BDD12DRAFT_324425 [Trichophaea hybrida]|nr:hypothetical protein BDD12DRAFT_324425 [Trichophaea hybrida]
MGKCITFIKVKLTEPRKKPNIRKHKFPRRNYHVTRHAFLRGATSGGAHNYPSHVYTRQQPLLDLENRKTNPGDEYMTKPWTRLNHLEMRSSFPTQDDTTGESPESCQQMRITRHKTGGVGLDRECTSPRAVSGGCRTSLQHPMSWGRQIRDPPLLRCRFYSWYRSRPSRMGWERPRRHAEERLGWVSQWTYIVVSPEVSEVQGVQGVP